MIEDTETLNNSQAVEESRSAKKPYQSPQMRIYGNIREVTQGTGHNSNRDSPSNPASHKSLP